MVLPTHNVKARDPVGSKNIQAFYYYYYAVLSAYHIAASEAIMLLK